MVRFQKQDFIGRYYPGDQVITFIYPTNMLILKIKLILLFSSFIKLWRYILKYLIWFFVYAVCYMGIKFLNNFIRFWNLTLWFDTLNYSHFLLFASVLSRDQRSETESARDFNEWLSKANYSPRPNSQIRINFNHDIL